MSERSDTLRLLWAEVNRLADAEDTLTIRRLIGEAGVAPRSHVGRPKEDFSDPDVMAEYVLGQWADIIDGGAMYALNAARNISHARYDEMHGAGAR